MWQERVVGTASSAAGKVATVGDVTRTAANTAIARVAPGKLAIAFPGRAGIRKLVVAFAAVVAGCAGLEGPPAPSYRELTAAEGRALVARLLPEGIGDRSGWATDLYAAIAALGIEPSRSNVCSAIAVIGQESGFRADPPVPGLAAIAWKEIERLRERSGVPRLVLDAALALDSPTGRTYRARIDAVKTERELSAVFEDFIAMVPLGKTFLASRNPVRTGGSMQVSVAYAEAHAAEKSYPYPVDESIRHEVFTRRGGLYFGVAHLLDYPARYDRPLYRFADYNAGHYASRNAAFQAALTQATGIPLALDGDLLRYDDGRPAREPGSTELAARMLGRRLDLDGDDVRRDLERGREPAFEQTRLYRRTFALVDRIGSSPAPRALVPQIPLRSPKITRNLTTEWFATRVDARYRACLARGDT
jgi:hypothetical protein